MVKKRMHTRLLGVQSKKNINKSKKPPFSKMTKKPRSSKKKDKLKKDTTSKIMLKYMEIFLDQASTITQQAIGPQPAKTANRNNLILRN